MANLIIRRGMTKRAAAEDGPTFEQQFGILANAIIADKFPKLDRMKLAFQLIEKSDDNADAVGAAVYVVGGTVIFVPAFYKNSRIRTGDMMFLAQTQQFLPLSDPWLAWVQEKELPSAGDIAGEKDGDRVPGGESVTISSLTDPIVKLGSVCLRGMLHTDPDLTRTLDGSSLLDTCLAMGKTASEGMLDNLIGNRDFLNASLRFYSGDELDEFARKAAGLSGGGDDLEVVLPYTKEAAALSARDRELLDRDGFLIRKEAADSRAVLRSADLRDSLVSVNRPCVADLITVNGTVRTCVVLAYGRLDDSGGWPVPMCDAATRTYGDAGDAASFMGQTGKRFVAVPAGEGGALVELPLGTVAVADSIRPLEERDLKRLGKSAATNPRADLGYYDLLVCPNGLCYRVGRAAAHGNGWFEEYGLGEGGTYHMVGDDITQTAPIGGEGTVIWPKASRVVQRRDSEVEDGPRNRVRFMSVNDMDAFLTRYMNARFSKVKVTASGDDAVLYGDLSDGSPLSVKEASLHLVRDYGVSPEDARNMLHATFDKPGAVRSESFLICKTASEGDPWKDADIPMTRVENLPETREFMQMPTVLESPEQLQKAVTMAAESGIKEVFDVTAFKLLVRQNQFMDEIHEDLPMFMKALDSLCRKLFMLYWHTEEFEDAYGTVKLKSLEESLKNTISSLSDLTIFFKMRGRDDDGGLYGDDGELMEGHGL